MFDNIFVFIHGAFAWAISGALESYPALFLVVAFGEMVAVAPFILEGVYLTAGINLAAGGDFGALRLFVITLPAAEVGAAAVYWLARAGKTPILRTALPLLRIRSEQVQVIQGWLHHAGPWPVAIGRMIPGLVIPISILAGVLRIPYRRFFMSVLIANALWSSLFLAMGIGIRLGIGGVGPSVEDDITAFKLGLIPIAVLAVVTLLIYFLWRPRAAKRDGYEVTSAIGEREDAE